VTLSLCIVAESAVVFLDARDDLVDKGSSYTFGNQSQGERYDRLPGRNNPPSGVASYQRRYHFQQRGQSNLRLTALGTDLLVLKG